MTLIPPPEWAPQSALFTAFPSDGELWLEDLEPAQAEVAAMVRQLAETVPVKLLADGAEAVAAAKAQTGGNVEIFDVAFGDIWVRDTGPIFTSANSCVRYGFNGWGGKYDLPADLTVGAEIAGLMSASVDLVSAVMEGGALEYNGQGLILTTEQCLLNPNRNTGWTKKDAELVLKETLGATRVIWLGDGLLNDHTDGHVDNLARFVSENTVAVPQAWSAEDPNADVFKDAAERVRAAGLSVVYIPSVGLYEMDGEAVPASHMNWIVANGQVVVPLYGTESDARAVEAVKAAFPRHKVTGLPANAILTGGGSFHCITQQVPEGQI